MIPQKRTNKLFYDKWRLKISLLLDGSFYVRYKTLEQIKNLTDIDFRFYKNFYRFHNNKEKFVDLYTCLENYNSSLYSVRVQQNTFDIYTNEESLISKIIEILPRNIRYVQRPDPSTENVLLDNKKTLIVKKYPQDKFKLRVYLKPHTVSTVEEKVRILDWISTQPGMSISLAVQKWFVNTSWNWDRRYMLVEDEKSLLMLKLKNSSMIGSVYHLIPQK